MPVSIVLDTFACNTMGVKYSEFCADLDVAGQTMLAATQKLGDVDSVQWASYAPAILGMLWLSPMKLPGRDLPDDALWQLDEQVRIQPEDYDRIVAMGWGPWFGQYIGQYLGDAAAAGAAMQEKAPRWVGEFMGRGYVVFSAIDGRPSLRAPLRRPDDPGIHHGPVHEARQGRSGDAGRHG